MKKLISLLIPLCLGVTASAVTPLWLRDVKISPDGKEIAFTYKGDIWKVAATGGEAQRLTTQNSYEANPLWSPDGKSIAFASDRHGNFDIFVMPASGGQAKRLTFNSASEIPESFSADGKEVYYSASIQDPAKSILFPSSRMTELYAVAVDGKSGMKQVLGTPAQMISWLPDGKSFLYQDTKGMEDEWRKHHTSSITRDLWKYDASTGKHTNLTNRGGEDRNPVVGDNNDFYFLSERNGGSMNVYKASINNPAEVKALTSFKTHPVRFLSRASKGDGTLCFTYDGEIYTMPAAGGSPKKVNITVNGDYDKDETSKMAVRSASEVEASPDGKSIAFISRGNVFVTSVDYATTKQITDTPEAESDLYWAPDSKSLIYTSERDGRYNIYQAKMVRPDEEINFPNATLIVEEPLFKPDNHERTAAQISPDGKSLAFILDRNKLMVMDLKTKKVRQLTDGSTNRNRGGRFGYYWSPDSKWIALNIVDRKHDPYTDIAIINVASGEMTNITNSGYFDESPRWVLDGNAILYESERYGMRNHASWGSMSDMMLVFLNQEAYDRFNLNAEDLELLKEVEKKAKKDEPKADKKDDSKATDKKAAPEKKSKDITVELEGLQDRIVRLTPQSSALNSGMLTSDGETLYYIATLGTGAHLFKVGLRKPDFRMVTKLAPGLRRFQTDKDGKNWFIVGSSASKFDPKTEKITPITYSATMKLDPEKEREYLFDYVYREEKERFYTPTMHGVNWDKMTADYRKFLHHINNNYDFAELLSELLGELNVSHTGGRYRPVSSANADRTASLGLLYDLNFSGKGMKVAEVLEGGPLFKAKSKVKPGCIIEKINGEEITPANDITLLLNDMSGKKTLISVYNPADNSRWEEVVVPVTAAKNNSLLYDRWVKQRAADVDRWSNGRLGYVHITSMNDDSFRDIYSDILGKYNDREGIVIDIRWNGGGRLHEDIEVLFSGKKYLTQEIRGNATCDMPSRRWNKPSIMLMCEACYSNAHGTPWVYKHQNLGKLVGMPVAGTMTSVNWVTTQDPTIVFGIPVVGYRTAEGNFLENSQLEPDVKVVNTPEAVVNGEDLQLKAAVDELLKDLDAKKK